MSEDTRGSSGEPREPPREGDDIYLVCPETGRLVAAVVNAHLGDDTLCALIPFGSFHFIVVTDEGKTWHRVPLGERAFPPAIHGGPSYSNLLATPVALTRKT